MPTVTFHGACGVVTGSCTHLSFGNDPSSPNFLVDCGMYQGGEDLKERNWSGFEFDPSRLTGVVVTHAHLDHIGRLPLLVKRGFRGPIYCTPASRGLVSLILEDAAEIQEEQARYARKKGYSRHKDPQPLYTTGDAKQAIKQLEKKPFDEVHELAPGLRVRFHRAGHLLGASHVEWSAKGSDGERRSWVFSGDVGRWGVPILQDPQPPQVEADALLLESTYGDREHNESQSRQQLREIIDRVFEAGGKVMIPAFALGRTQEVLYYLAEMVEEGVLDPSAVFLDSPMAIDATELYDRAEREHDEELKALAASGDDPLARNTFNRCRSVADSKALNDRQAPAVIVATSGMATAGRIVHHFMHHLGDPKSAVVFTGYQAHGTRGRALLEGAQSVGIHGGHFRVRASVHSLQGLSAHADCKELVRWCSELPGPPRRLFLNHGEDPPRKALAARLQEELPDWPAAVLPKSGHSVDW